MSLFNPLPQISPCLHKEASQDTARDKDCNRALTPKKKNEINGNEQKYKTVKQIQQARA